MRHNIGFWVVLAVMAVASVQFARTSKLVGQNPSPVVMVASAEPAKAAAPAPVSAPTAPPGAIALHANRSGHFLTQAVVDGRSMSMMVDTGASLCVFSEEDAERMGIRLRPSDFTRTSSTANGLVRIAPVRIGVIQIGSIVVRDVEAAVIPRGLLGTNLLGMSFLKRVRDFSIAGGSLTIRG